MKSFFKKILQKAGYRLIKINFFEKHYHSNNDPEYRRSGDLNPLEQLFYKYLNDDFFFIQVGANNGKRYDPIHHLIVREKEKVKGIAIEPVPEYFEELKETYKDFPQIKLLNKAIHNSETEATIYKIDPNCTNGEERLKGMSSFDPNNFIKDGVRAENIVAEKISCISLMELIEQEKVKKVHLLQIDAEGYDLEIINSIDFDKIKPHIINFEHRWQYNLIPESEIFKALKKMIDNGYKILLNGNDALGYFE